MPAGRVIQISLIRKLLFMIYHTLFLKQDTFSEGNFRYFHYHNAGRILPQWECRYPMLFVLQGMLVMDFSLRHICIAADYFAVLDIEELQSYSCADNTIVVEYMPPVKLSGYFSTCSCAFRTPISTIVPILSPLREWIDSLLQSMAQGRITDLSAPNCSNDLTDCLLKYPVDILGELYVPFYANFSSRRLSK
jgi:hypothetical protein